MEKNSQWIDTMSLKARAEDEDERNIDFNLVEDERVKLRVKRRLRRNRFIQEDL